MHPLVSFIVPAYNQGEFLEEAIVSIYAQDYRPLQVIVINDGSTDATGAVMEKLRERFPDIEYIDQENAGVCLACNRAFEKVKGEYFIRLDADDYLPPTYVSVLLAALQKDPAAAYAYCDAEYVGSRQGRMLSAPFSLARLVQENYIHVSSLLRTEVVRQTGYLDPAMAYSFEDWDFWLKLAEKGFKGVYCKETWLYYRQKESGGRNDAGAERHRAMRDQIRRNHPRLYAAPANRLRVAAWKAKRRIRHYLRK